jgi:hypothetical protein
MTDMSHQVEADLADMWYVEEALAHFATIYREAVYRYLDEHPEPNDDEPAVQRVEAAVEFGMRQAGW